MSDKMIKKEKHKLYILLLIFGISILFSSNILAGGLRTIHEKTFKVEPGQKLTVDVDIADVYVKVWDKNEVYIKVSGNRKADDNIHFEFDQTSEGVFVYGEKEGGWFSSLFSSIDLKIEIMTPVNFDGNIKTSGGDVLVDDLNGNIDLTTSGGDIEMQSTEGRLNAKTSGGDIKLDRHNGSMELTTSGGDITCRSVSGSLDAGTSGGDIDVSCENGKIHTSTSGGDIRIDYLGENSGIEAYTSGGDITLKLPSDLKADVYLKSSGGDVEVDYPSTRSRIIEEGKFEGEFNGGGSLIKCRTSGGDLVVRVR